MSVLITVLYREALTARGALNRVERWGPLMMLLVAIPLILADPTRHLLGDYHIWEGCGNNRVYSRINSSNAFRTWSGPVEITHQLIILHMNLLIHLLQLDYLFL